MFLLVPTASLHIVSRSHDGSKLYTEKQRRLDVARALAAEPWRCRRSMVEAPGEAECQEICDRLVSLVEGRLGS